MTMARSPAFFRVPPIAAAIVAIAFQTVVIGYMVQGRASILRSGTDIWLETAPVDPRDLLRGDYVILSYPVSTISKAMVTGEIPKESGRQRMSVRLKPGVDGFWTVAEASFGDLPSREGMVVMRTLPFHYYVAVDGGMPELLFVTYGIERYYVPEGEGRVLEDARNDGALEVEARVSADGTPQIVRLILDGKPIYEEPLY
jgi:uncharacterized membrane-anchored protein